jgi:hypothetical protein
MNIRAGLVMMVGLAVPPVATVAYADVIQVYDAEIAAPGAFNLMGPHQLHAHY